MSIGLSYDGNAVMDMTAGGLTISVPELVINSLALSDSIIVSNAETKTFVNGNYVYNDLVLRNYTKVPDVSNALICDANFNVTDQLALQTHTGYLRLEGREFEDQTLVAIDSIPFDAEVLNSNAMHVETSNLTPGFKDLVLMSPSGAVSNSITIAVSDGPVLNTKTLPDAMEGIPYLFTLTGTSDSAIRFSSSTMPTGLTLLEDGTIFGTVPSIPADTVFHLNVRATDQEHQYIDTPLSLSTRQFLTGKEFSKQALQNRYRPDSISSNSTGLKFAVSYTDINTVCIFKYSKPDWSNFITLVQATISGFGKWIRMIGDQLFVLSDNDVNVYDVSRSPVKRIQTVQLPNTKTICLNDDASIMVQGTSSGVVRIFFRNAVNTYVLKQQISLSGEEIQMMEIDRGECFVTTATGTLYALGVSQTSVEINNKYVHNTQFDNFGLSLTVTDLHVVVGVPVQNQVFVFDRNTFGIVQVIPNFAIPGFGSSIRRGKTKLLINGEFYIYDGASLVVDMNISPPGVQCVCEISHDEEVAYVFSVYSSEPVNIDIGRVWVRKFNQTQYVLSQT